MVSGALATPPLFVRPFRLRGSGGTSLQVCNLLAITLQNNAMYRVVLLYGPLREVTQETHALSRLRAPAFKLADRCSADKVTCAVSARNACIKPDQLADYCNCQDTAPGYRTRKPHQRARVVKESRKRTCRNYFLLYMGRTRADPAPFATWCAVGKIPSRVHVCARALS